jgi:hypothetical protein
MVVPFRLSVLAGRVSSHNLINTIKKGMGPATLKTVQGDTIKARLQGGSVVLTDEEGGQPTVTDVYQIERRDSCDRFRFAPKSNELSRVL